MGKLNLTTSSNGMVMAGLIALSSASPALAEEYSCQSYYNEFSEHSGSGISVVRNSSSNDEAFGDVAVDSVISKLALDECPSYIKKSFGLNVTDISKVLGVSRPTAYKYLDGDIPFGENATVIEEVYRLAQIWEVNAEGSSLGMEFKRNYRGHSVYSLLVEQDFVAAESLLVEIAKVVVARHSRADKAKKHSKNNAFSPDMVRKTVG